MWNNTSEKYAYNHTFITGWTFKKANNKSLDT